MPKTCEALDAPPAPVESYYFLIWFDKLTDEYLGEAKLIDVHDEDIIEVFCPDKKEEVHNRIFKVDKDDVRWLKKRTVGLEIQCFKYAYYIAWKDYDTWS